MNTQESLNTDRIDSLKKQIETFDEKEIKEVLQNKKLTHYEWLECVDHLHGFGAQNIECLENPIRFPLLLKCLGWFFLYLCLNIICELLGKALLAAGSPEITTGIAIGAIAISSNIYIFQYFFRANVPERRKNLKKINNVYRLLMRYQPELEPDEE